MNAIESDFLKLLTFDTDKKRPATELAGKVQRFVEWLCYEDIELCSEGMIKDEKGVRWVNNDMEEHTLSDLYSYWLEEFDNKQ